MLQLKDFIKKIEEKYNEMLTCRKKKSHFKDCASSNIYVTTVPDNCMCMQMYMFLSHIKQMYQKVCHVLK